MREGSLEREDELLFLDEKSYMKTYAFHIDVSLLQNVKSTLQCLQKTSLQGLTVE